MAGKKQTNKQTNKKQKTCLAMQQTKETQVQSLDWEDPLEKEMKTHFVWNTSCTEDPGRLEPMGLQS